MVPGGFRVTALPKLPGEYLLLGCRRPQLICLGADRPQRRLQNRETLVESF